MNSTRIATALAGVACLLGTRPATAAPQVATCALPFLTAASPLGGPHGAAVAPLFADGSVECGGADDLSHRAGTVVLRPVAGGISFHVVLTHAAPDWPYYVELSQGGTCAAPLRFYGFTTGPQGQGVFEGVYPAGPGPRSILVDVVSDSRDDPTDPTLREIAPGSLLEVTLPAGDDTTLTLGFDAGAGALPWSEQGFTFHGEGTVSGQALEQASWGGFFPVSTVVLTREDGGPFDAVSLDVVDFWFWQDGYAWVESDLGGYRDLWPGTTLLDGPEWDGITALYVSVWGLGDGGGVAADLYTDNYVVRVPKTP